MVASRSQSQARGLLLLLLVLGQEAQVVSAKIADAPNNGTLGDGGAVKEELEAFKTPPEAVKAVADVAILDPSEEHRDSDSFKDNLAAGNLSSYPVDDEGASADPRFLLTPASGWAWPAGTTLMLRYLDNQWGPLSFQSTDVVTLVSSLTYTYIAITAPVGTNFNPDHANARVKLVSDEANRYRCSATEFNMPVGQVQQKDPVTQQTTAFPPADMGLTNGPLGLSISANNVLNATAASIVFMWGGKFKLCYTPDGSFDVSTMYRENVVSVNLKVLGVRSPCTNTPNGVTDGCLKEERWECSFAYKGEPSPDCVFNFKADGGRQGWSVETGDRNKITWSEVYGADSHTGGVLTQDYPKYCTDADATTTNLFDVTTTGVFLDADTATAATMPPVVDSRFLPFTVAACYCPSYDVAGQVQRCVGSTTPDNCCDDYREYIQQVGVLYYWTIRICDYDGGVATGYDQCTTPYMRVIPQQMFVTRVECPPGGGCFGTDENRIMYIDTSENNDRPTWDYNNGCKTTTTEPAEVVWPTISDSRSESGGTRIDYKVWRNKQVKFALSVKQAMDLCFCNKNCQIATNWFKIGQIRTSNNFAYASKTAASGGINTIKYVDYEGSLTLFGGILSAVSSTTADPYDGNQYSGKALVNIISYDRELLYGYGVNRKTLEQHHGMDLTNPPDFQMTMDGECQRERYSATLVTGPSHQQAAKAYIAKIADNSINQYHSFSGENHDQKIKMNRAGVIAICYCAMVNDQNECDDPKYWYFTGRMTIQGPQGGQQWIFPTHIVIGLSVLGWGLSGSDKLRIIPATSTCQDNTNNPTGDNSFKVNCPAQDGLGCTTAGLQEDIMVNSLTAQTASITLSNVQTSATHTELTFSAPIDQVLMEDDIITIDMGRVLVDGNLPGAMTAAQKFEAYKLSGEYEFQDTIQNSVPDTYQVGHRVKPVIISGQVDTSKLSIPMGWPVSGGPTFTFESGQGWWTRRNKVTTNAEIKGKDAQANLKLCWGVFNSGTTLYYSEAGEVTFQDPPAMRTARINLTTKMRDAVAPVVISIETGGQRNEYASATGKTMLMLRFLDVSESQGKLIPFKAGDVLPTASFSSTGATGTPGTLNPNDEILPGDAKQWLCASLFNELWSSHEEGFPLPHGCFYSKKYKDQPEGDSPTFYREITIVFSERNGLRQGVNYQLVMNTQTKIVQNNERLVDLYAMCFEETGCDRPYMVFEKGEAKASMATEAAAGSSDPAWGPNGFLIQRVDSANNVKSLSSENILQTKLTGGATLNAIKKSSIIRVYLWPLTQWSIGSASCTAECEKYHAGNQQCSGKVGCDPEEAVSGSNRKNIIKLTLPSDMDDINDKTTHTIKITGLTLPVNGFFPTRTGAQLTKDDDSSPTYQTSTGMLWKDPEPGQTTGRLVLSDRTGYGPRPFAGETLPNTLYIRLQVGATIWNVGGTGGANAASITVTLPQGYTCSVPDGGVPPLNMPVFLKDIPVDNYPDNNRGVLSVDTADGDWDNSMANVCEYHFNQYNAMFAGQVAYVKLTVTNPTDAKSKFNSQNIWKLKISSKGANSLAPVSYDMTEVQFITLTEEQTLNDDGLYWAGNAAVISQLSNEVIQPADFTRSCCGTAFDQRMTQEYLRVFFKTGENVGQNGFVIVDAPDGFDFSQSCSARDLDARYYAFAGADSHQLKRLVNMGTCEGSRYPPTASTYNRAKLEVKGNIGPNFYYGFEVRVTHPSTYTTSQHSEWYIWTQDFQGYGIEGSYYPVKFNPLQAPSQTEFYHKSWGMYDAEADVELLIESMRPRSVSNVPFGEKVFVYPIEFPVATETSLRITAPVGFVWADPVDDFTRRSNFTTEDFPVPTIDNGVPNQLIWQSFTFKGNTKYGFVAKIEVPNHNPRNSSNSFFIEFGFREQTIEKRLMASVLPAPPVAALINCQVGYASNLVSYNDNRMEFSMQTVSRLIETDGIVIKGDQNTRGFIFEAACNPVMLPDSPPMAGVLCTYVKATDSTPQITLKVLNGQSLDPGYYRFELKVSNPITRILTAGTWTFGSYHQVDTYPSNNIVDAELVAPGFVVNDAMTDARLIDITETQRQATNRNDRPGQPNQLIFRFKLKDSPQTPKVMVLQAPRGFIFDQDCIKGLRTSANEVFGDNTEGAWPPDYEKWPSMHAPYACEGEGHIARISIPDGLLRRYFYAFRIAIAANPMTTPEWNLWSISYNDETSAPFQGFTVWTFTGLETPLPVSYAKSPTGANVKLTENPVQLQFQPYKTIPAAGATDLGGLLRISAPPGFAFVSTNNECIVDVFETGMMASTLFTNQDYQCEVDQTGGKLNLKMIGSRAIHGLADGQGKAYTLVVRVYNPPGTASAGFWELDSFATITADLPSALDVSRVEGFPINDVLVTYTVTNVNNVRRGNVAVNDVDITLRFPDPIKDNDRIVVRGPMGFNLVGDAETSTCNNFRYPGNNDPFPTTGFPSCQCEVGLNCTVQWLVRENKDPAYPQNEDIRFKIATSNPSQTPLLIHNFWSVTHTRGNVIKSSHVARSWDINPQLDPVDIQITGSNLAAETLSDLTFTMTPVSDAGTIKIEALYPTEFDFSMAMVSVPFDIDPQSQGPTVIVNLRTNPLVAGQPFELRINSVQLGRGGGQTRWNLFTYLDESMQHKLDERLNFEGGFRLPGKITVLGDPVLKSQYADMRNMFPVKSLFQPRVKEDAKAEFRLSFSQQVAAQQTLKITCQGEGAYLLRPTPFIIIGIGQIQVSTVLDQNGALLVTLLPGRPASEIALQSNTPYTITMQVFPQPGTNTWRFDTLDSQGFTNTNDGMTQGFNPVERMQLTVQVQRSPPGAIIDVTLNIDWCGDKTAGTAGACDSSVRELIVIAPNDFEFDDRAAGCGDMCTPGQSMVGRRTATIASPTGDALTKLTGLRIRVHTPQETPLGMGSEGITWFVEGKGQGAGSTTGWGEGSGFMVTQMSGTTVSYAGIPGLVDTQIAFTFSVDVDAGSIISVEPPAGYLLTCSQEGSLKQISLPGDLPNCIDDPLQLQLMQPLVSGQYAFAVNVDLPPVEPEVNTFNIIIRDQDNQVVDAAYRIPGHKFHPRLSVQNPTLTWSRADPGQSTIVTIGLDFVQSTNDLKAVLISLPDLFHHDVQIPIDVVNINKNFPVAAGMDWADTSEPTRIKIFLDDSDENTMVQGPDTYQFQFPVLMPPEVPKNNIWFISLCTDRSCTQPTDIYVAVSFPIAGFKLRELPPEAVRLAAGGSRRRADLGFGAMLLALFALVAVAL